MQGLMPRITRMAQRRPARARLARAGQNDRNRKPYSERACEFGRPGPAGAFAAGASASLRRNPCNPWQSSVTLEGSMISFANVSKQYGKQILFVDASFQLNPGEKVGLVGPNGAGKTTLFRMIVGEEAPDEGEVTVPKKLTIGYFRQDVEEMSGRSVLDEAIAGSGRARRPASRARGAAARDGRSRRAPTTWTRSSRASARCRRSTSTSAATRSKARRAKCCTASASTTSGSTATSARCPAAGRCASRWRACCSASPTSC